jgi:hypothetical protein
MGRDHRDSGGVANFADRRFYTAISPWRNSRTCAILKGPLSDRPNKTRETAAKWLDRKIQQKTVIDRIQHATQS